MATVAGGLFHPTATTSHVAGAPRPDAGPLSLSSITDAHATIAGSGGTSSGSGFDTVSGPQTGGGFAGTPASGTEQVVATQTQDGAGNTVLHLPDGSTITLVGITHVDGSFIH